MMKHFDAPVSRKRLEIRLSYLIKTIFEEPTKVGLIREVHYLLKYIKTFFTQLSQANHCAITTHMKGTAIVNILPQKTGCGRLEVSFS